ncbi:MAG: hypothetical protein ROW48_03390 [Bellilinea sp.]|jgi:hypothetical protein
MNAVLDFVPIILLMLTSIGLALYLPWRWSVIALAIQYLGVFWLVSQSLPLGLAAVKLVIGWMAGAVLATSQVNAVESQSLTDLSGRVFRVLTTLFSFIVVFSIDSQIQVWLAIQQPVLLGGLILLAAGLVQMGMTVAPFRLIIGLLTFIAGFEVLYAELVSSVLVVGLLGIITLGLAMAGSYFIAASSLEGSQ